MSEPDKIWSEDELILRNNALMKWSCKMRDASNKRIFHQHILAYSGATLMCVFATWAMWDMLPENRDILYMLYAVAFGFMSIITAIVRQKTVFNYCICADKAFLKFYLYYPSYASALFKTIALSACLIFFGLAVFTGSLLPLIGPAAIALGSARSLLSWENQVTNHQSLPWDEHNFVTIDHKRKIIVIHKTDIPLGFDARFTDQTLFDQYLAFIRTVLPSTAEYRERDWDAADAYE